MSMARPEAITLQFFPSILFLQEERAIIAYCMQETSRANTQESREDARKQTEYWASDTQARENQSEILKFR